MVGVDILQRPFKLQKFPFQGDGRAVLCVVSAQIVRHMTEFKEVTGLHPSQYRFMLCAGKTCLYG